MIKQGKIKAGGVAAPSASVKHIKGNSIPKLSQKAIVLAAIKHGSTDAVQFRLDYGIMNPSARISELRKQFSIVTERVNLPRPGGGCYRGVAKYSLLPEVSK